MAQDHSAHSVHHIVPGFGADRAAHYDAQAALSLAGVQAMYELVVSAMTSRLDGQQDASLLAVGLGTGTELLPYLRFDVPGWRFTGIDPSAAMLDVARKRLETEGLLSRAHIHVGELKSLPEGPPFDGAQMMGILHHVEGDAARLELLREVARRLKPGAPFVIGCRVGKDPVLTDVEFRRLRAHGIPKEELDHRRKLFDAKVTPIESDEALASMLEQAGFAPPKPLFVSLQFKVFLTQSGTASQG